MVDDTTNLPSLRVLPIEAGQKTVRTQPSHVYFRGMRTRNISREVDGDRLARRLSYSPFMHVTIQSKPSKSPEPCVAVVSLIDHWRLRMSESPIASEI